MVSVGAIELGVMEYVNTELLPNVLADAEKNGQGLKKILINGALILFMGKFESMFRNLMKNEMVLSLGIIDENGMIDLDLLHQTAKMAIANSGSIKQTIPMLGNFEFDDTDLDKLFSTILKQVEAE
jgi:hypothetical protein